MACRRRGIARYRGRLAPRPPYSKDTKEQYQPGPSITFVNNSTLSAFVKGDLKLGENSLEIKCEKSVSKDKNLDLDDDMSDEEKAMLKQIYEKRFEKIEININQIAARCHTKKEVDRHILFALEKLYKEIWSVEK